MLRSLTNLAQKKSDKANAHNQVIVYGQSKNNNWNYNMTARIFGAKL